ncbi:unnamed protein product, partial [Prorocentrum cordatum]
CRLLKDRELALLFVCCPRRMAASSASAATASSERMLSYEDDVAHTEPPASCDEAPSRARPARAKLAFRAGTALTGFAAVAVAWAALGPQRAPEQRAGLRAVVQQAEKKRSKRAEKKQHEEVVADPLQAVYDAAGAREWALGELSDRWKEAEERAQKLLGEISMDDKLALLHGRQTESGYAGYVASDGIPGSVPLRMNDGPQGFNPYTEEANQGTTTQFPCLLAVAATFDPEASRRYANAIAEEFVGKGANVLLGPDVEVLRVAVAGRSFETLSGEDPYLGSQLVKPFVEAVQGKGIIATVKHWLNNNQEVMRMTMSVEVGDRAQHEIYTPVFKAAFEAGAAAVMCSYNKVYGTYACENDRILKKLLRDDLGFRGLLMSDWEATHDAKASANGGLDIEMPTDANFAELGGLVGSGEVSEETIDAMAGHVLASMYFAGQFDGKFEGEVLDRVSFDDVTSDEHREVAKQTIIDSAVLVKNEDHTLPIEAKGKKIAMIGKYCRDSTWESDYMGTSSPFMAGGSGYVTTTRTIPPLKALQDLVQDAESIEWRRVRWRGSRHRHHLRLGLRCPRGLGSPQLYAARGRWPREGPQGPGRRQEGGDARHRARRGDDRVDQGHGRRPLPLHARGAGGPRGGRPADRRLEPRGEAADLAPERRREAPGHQVHGRAVPRLVRAPRLLVRRPGRQLLGGRPHRLPLVRRERHQAEVPLRVRAHLHGLRVRGFRRGVLRCRRRGLTRGEERRRPRRRGGAPALRGVCQPEAVAPADPRLPEGSGASGEVGASDVCPHGGRLELVRRGRKQVAVRFADWREDHHQRRELLGGPHLEQDPRLRWTTHEICEQESVQVALWIRVLAVFFVCGPQTLGPIAFQGPERGRPPSAPLRPAIQSAFAFPQKLCGSSAPA